MLPQSAGSLQSSLNSINHILSTTPPAQLPYLLPSLVDAVGDCKGIFSDSQKSESAGPIHKYKTAISALLHGKSVEGRWAAVGLIKCTVDVGQWEVLHDCTSWVRGLLAILGKPDPPTTKSLCILALTKIYLLNRTYPTLVREISTPTLPSFVTSCINLIAASTPPTSDGSTTDVLNPLVEPILYAFYQLLNLYPTIFRPFGARIQGIVLPLLAPTSPSHTGQPNLHKISNGLASPQVVHLGRQTFVHLHFCAPKNASDREWAAAFGAVIAELHKTADIVFRSVVEKWNGAGRPPGDANPVSFGGVVPEMGDSAMGLPSWSGIFAGGERLTGLLNLLRQFFLEPTASAVTFPLGVTVDLLMRTFSISFPSVEQKDRYGGIQFRPEFVKEEREGLCARLPRIHVAAMEIVSAMVERLGLLILPLTQGILEQVIWIFNSSQNIDVKTATYTMVAKILGVVGLCLPKSLASTLSVVIQHCCKDILPKVQITGNEQPGQDSRNGKGRNGSKAAVSSMNADAYLGPRASANPGLSKFLEEFSDLHQSAWTLLPLFITHLQPDYIEFSVRAQIDRTAILRQHKVAMTASILQPPRIESGRKVLSSIMPHLARAFGRDPDIEGMLRPRMPIISSPVYATAPTNTLETSRDPEAMDLDNEDQNHDNDELRSKTHPTESQGYGPKETSSTMEKTAQVTLHGDTPDQTRVPEEQIDHARKRPAKEMTTLASHLPAASISSADLPPEHLPAVENSPPFKRPRLDTTTQTPMATGTTSDAQALITRLEEQPSAVAEMTPEPPHIPTNTMAEDPLSAPSRQQDQDSDDSFEIPELVLDADTDEEDEVDGDDNEEEGIR